MAEYIKREDAIDLFWATDPENDGRDGCTIALKCGNFDSNEIEAMLSALPAADIPEVRHGKWIENTFCSCCGGFNEDDEGNIIQSSYDYCPYCGARMDKEDEK